MLALSRRALLATATAFAPLPALAQPERSIRLLLGMPAGATPDLLTRLLAARLQAATGQMVVVENRPGAAGNLAAAALARAVPDGATLGTLLGATLAINRHLYPEMPFDPARDFTPLIRFARFPGVVLLPPESPVRSLAELGPWLRSQARPVLCATPGAGTIPHLAAEMLVRAFGARAEMVHYRGDPDALRDLAAGRTGLMVAPLPAALPQIAARRPATDRRRAPAWPGGDRRNAHALGRRPARDGGGAARLRRGILAGAGRTGRAAGGHGGTPGVTSDRYPGGTHAARPVRAPGRGNSGGNRRGAAGGDPGGG